MKKLFRVLAVLVLIFGFTEIGFARDVKVRGYYRKDGTYVAPHYRSAPNNTVRDNWSYKGNINPYTGKEGTNYYRDNPTSEYYKEPSYKPYKAPSYDWSPSYKQSPEPYKPYETPSYKVPSNPFSTYDWWKK